MPQSAQGSAIFTATEIAQFQQTQTHPWQNEANSALALILLADQFPRNIYRDTPQAFCVVRPFIDARPCDDCR